MAIEVMTRVWKEGPEDKTETLVLLYLADKASEDGTKCYPSISRIADRCRLSRQGAMNVLARLEDKGWITKHSGGGRGYPNHYTIHLNRFGKKSSPDDKKRQPEDEEHMADKAKGSSSFTVLPKGSSRLTVLTKGSSCLDGLSNQKGKADKEKGKADKAKGSSCLDGNRNRTVNNRQNTPRVCAQGARGDGLPANPDSVTPTPKAPDGQKATKKVVPPTPTSSTQPNSAPQTPEGSAAPTDENSTGPQADETPSAPDPNEEASAENDSPSDQTSESSPDALTEDGNLTRQSLAVLRQISRGEVSIPKIKAHPPNKNWAVAMYEKYIGTNLTVGQQYEINEDIEDPTRWAEAIKTAQVDNWRSPGYSIDKITRYYEESATSEQGQIASAGNTKPTSGNTAN